MGVCFPVSQYQSLSARDHKFYCVNIDQNFSLVPGMSPAQARPQGGQPELRGRRGRYQ